MSLKFNHKVYQLVKQIPKGKVATYGQIAMILGHPRWSRQVGWALHVNHDQEVPCHRVVDRNGRVAPNFAFGGWREQRRRLESEGVEFKDKMHLDLDSCLWQEKIRNSKSAFPKENFSIRNKF